MRARSAIRRRWPRARYGGHAIWWTVEAAGPEQALALLPYFLAERATATRVDEVDIP